ncbi:BTB/POZ domain-containing protein 16 isoform X2 [Pangasianodon hypophthalmus]|uniref:BTB/POZ domain-containing protein 16 isoform X2 n=1 Tax=Pangasianodon hypophthalmus TaxID=310915 RepID=UPI002307EE6F|nr:BTB/POZ domain-containing protein 16 isoform X2 [Pangasianodon hypophthalmus]
MLSSRPSAHSRGDCPMCVGSAGRQRRQTGHTNRWQLAPPLPGDLLGQSQVKRATRAGLCVHTPHRSTRSADTLQQRRDDSPSQQPPPLHAGLWTSQNIQLSHTSANPDHAFYIVSQEVVQSAQPDAVLECFGSIWELHCPYLCESETLAELYSTSKKQRHTLLQERTESSVRERCVWRGGREMRLRQDAGMGKSRGSLTRPILLQLNINDPCITKESLSFALRSMYRRDACPDQWCEAVLSAATLLRLPQLKQRCLKEMISNISFSTVCDFHRVSCKYKQTSLQQACERWLELFLVTELSHRIDLRDLTFDLLLKTLQCPRVFTSSEYELLRTVLYWIYLQFNTREHTLPSHSTIISYFCRASGIFLEQPLGQTYAPLFQALRLHGITERQHMEEMQKINVFPHSWLHFTFSNLVYSIHSGGNMHITNFSKQAVRFGMTVTGEHCTHTVGLYGFYFLLRASRVGESAAFAFSMERLRHWDPVLAESCRTTQPFSMRAERCVCYQISVQSRVCGEWQERSSGELNQVFGLSRRCCRSKVFTVDGLGVPALVMFSLAFPSA